MSVNSERVSISTELYSNCLLKMKQKREMSFAYTFGQELDEEA